MNTWRNANPADLEELLPAITASDPETAVRDAHTVSTAWRRTPLTERIATLRECQSALRAEAEPLAHWIAREVGKPIAEARGELGAVIAKFDLTIADAEEFIADREVADGPHPAMVRHFGRGPAAVIAPFNFPIHLGHGAAVAYLLAGNPVLYKPSPLAAVTGAEYGALMAAHLPPGVFQIVQGGGEVGGALCRHPDVRAICFTGSIPVGTQLATELAADYPKSLALELGGKNASIVCADADLDLAASAITDALCLTAGQRCNATCVVYAERSILADLADRILSKTAAYSPGDPLCEATKLGPVISETAVDRYRALTALDVGEWILPPQIPARVDGRRGHFVTPAIVRCDDFARLAASPLFNAESFCPVLAIVPFDEDPVGLHNTSPFGLTASIFTADRARFHAIGDELRVGNLYWNLPTTFSPSTLPFGGLGISGNGRPGARGFIRFAADEQAVQWKGI